MTTADAINNANDANLAYPDIDLGTLLRDKILFELFEDVPLEVSWRRKSGTINIVQGTYDYALPADFDFFKELSLDPDNDLYLEYIGDQPDKMMASAANIANAFQQKPSGYYLYRVADPTYGAVTHITFDSPPDAAYTARYLYFFSYKFLAQESVELDLYIPPQFQWGIVEGLQREIYRRRFGVGDARYQSAASEFERYKARAANRPELANNNKAVFVF